MQNPNSNITINKRHYDELYGDLVTDTIVTKINNLNHFLNDATKTDTSWHGMYQGTFAKQIVNQKVLELGCGDGLNALVMAALGANVVAIDISEQSERMIREATSKLGLENVKAMTGDFAEMPFEPSSFDFIVGKAFLHHLTYDLEKEYLKKVSLLLKQDGEARFFEPAVNSKILDQLRWIIPVPGRPSRLNKRAFAEWKENDPHPERDNSSSHYIRIGSIFFNQIKIIPIGSIERLCRLIPQGKFNRRYRRWAHRIDPKLPYWFRNYAARSQLIIYHQPKK